VYLDKTQHRGFDAAEGEGKSNHWGIRPMRLLFDLGKAESHCGWVSVSRQGIDPGSTRVAETQQLSDLVEGFPGCIVERGANVAVAPLLEEIEMGMAPGNDQGQRASLPQLTVRHQDGVDVPLQVVDGHQRFVEGKGQRLGVSNSNQQCSGQARPLGDGDGIEILEADPCFLQRSPNDRHDIAQMFARGKFRNHPTIGRVGGDLRRHDVGKDTMSALHHRGRRLVTGTLNGKNQAARVAHLSIVVGMGSNAARDAAAEIVVRLRAAGHQAYFVGGCVRDLLMGREPKDFDVATSAVPDQVLALFERTFSVGAHFGVVLVSTGEIVTEVATFRSDGVYSDGRHPDAVRFAATAEEDVKRRDFTINGMMLDPLDDSVLDLVGGRKDLELGLVRAIGDSTLRFTEDKLRMLRGVRFAARFAFDLEPSTQGAIQQLAPLVNQVSRERVRDELTLMLTGGQARRAFELLDSTGLLAQVLPEVVKMKGVEQPPQYHPEGDVWVHTLMLLAGLPAGCPAPLAWGALLHDVGKPATFRVAPDRIRFDGHVEAGIRIAEEICRRLRLPNYETEQILLLIANHMRFADVQKMKESTLKRFFRLKEFDQHLDLHRLDCLASHGSLALYDFARERFETLPVEQVRPALLLTGKDLIEAGYKPGPLFSAMLTMAEDAQLDGAINSKDDALSLVEKHWPRS
jgi:putative nucleotidyltransferase with HDIG domain